MQLFPLFQIFAGLLLASLDKKTKKRMFFKDIFSPPSVVETQNFASSPPQCCKRGTATSRALPLNPHILNTRLMQTAHWQGLKVEVYHGGSYFWVGGNTAIERGHSCMVAGIPSCLRLCGEKAQWLTSRLP